MINPFIISLIFLPVFINIFAPSKITDSMEYVIKLNQP